MHGLQAVAHIRERARHDDAHGILQERLLHLLAQLCRLHGQFPSEIALGFAVLFCGFCYLSSSHHVSSLFSINLFGVHIWSRTCFIYIFEFVHAIPFRIG